MENEEVKKKKDKIAELSLLDEIVTSVGQLEFGEWYIREDYGQKARNIITYDSFRRYMRKSVRKRGYYRFYRRKLLAYLSRITEQIIKKNITENE